MTNNNENLPEVTTTTKISVEANTGFYGDSCLNFDFEVDGALTDEEAEAAAIKKLLKEMEWSGIIQQAHCQQGK